MRLAEHPMGSERSRLLRTYNPYPLPLGWLQEICDVRYARIPDVSVFRPFWFQLPEKLESLP